MNRRILILALLLILLTGGAVCALYYGNPAFRSYSGSMNSFPAFKPSEVASISVVWRNVQSNMILKDGRWVLIERNHAPASVPRISAFLQSLATLAPVKELTPCPESIRRSLHLIENDPSAIPGIRVTLRNKNGKELFEILLGKGHFVRPEPGSMPSSAPEGRYVKVGDRVYLIPVVFENCHPVPAAWVEPLRMYELRKALRMTVWQIDSGKRSLLWTCVRKSTAHPFMLGFPVGQKADNRILSGIAEKLSKPFSMDMAVDVNRLKPSLQLQIHCADGFTYRLDIADGGKTADFDHASLHVSFKRENVVSIPGETPQRKEQRYAVLEKRFAFESGYYNGRIFMIRKDIASALRILPVQQSDK